MQHQKILILDFGSQLTQLLARRVREAHVYCEVQPCDVSDEWLRAYHQRRGPCQCCASATACSPWRISAGAGSRAADSANSAGPPCAHAATPRCWPTLPTSPPPKATACSRCG